MKKLREETNNQIENGNWKIQFFNNLKNYFKQNIQFLTSDEAFSISKQSKPKQIYLRAKHSGTFKITNNIYADVIVFTKTLEKQLPTLKKYSEMIPWSSDQNSQQVEQKVEYFTEDDFLFTNPVPSFSIIKSFQYGKQMVPMSEAYLQQAELFTSKEIVFIGTVPKEKIPRQSFMGGCDILFAKQDSKISKLIISSLARACLELKKYLIAKLVLRQNCKPKLIVMIPCIKKNSEYFYINELPTAESIREYQFNSLKQSTKQQQQLMNQLIDSYSLDDEDEDSPHYFKIGSQLNETIVQINNLIFERGLSCQDKSIELSTNLERKKYFEENKQLMKEINQSFNLKINDNEQQNELNQKVFWKNLQQQQQIKDGEELIQEILKLKNPSNLEISNENKIRNFKDIEQLPIYEIIQIMTQSISSYTEFEEYSIAIQQIIQRFISTQIKNQNEQAIIELILQFRNKSIQFEQPGEFNKFLQSIKLDEQSEEFLQQMQNSGICSIPIDQNLQTVILTPYEVDSFIIDVNLVLERRKQDSKSKIKQQEEKNENSQIKQVNFKAKSTIKNKDYEQIYYSSDDELDCLIQNEDEQINEIEIRKKELRLNYDQNSPIKLNNATKKGKKLSSFTQLSSIASIQSDSYQYLDNHQEEMNQDLDSSQEEIKQDSVDESLINYKRINIRDNRFRILSNSNQFKLTLVDINLMYRQPQVNNINSNNYLLMKLFYPIKIIDIPSNSTPKDIFDKLWTEEIWELITFQTNKYSQQLFEENKLINLSIKDKQIQNNEQPIYFSKNTIKRFIICEILMGIQRLPSFSDYFSTDPLLSGGLNKIMSRNKYQLITKYFHLANNNTSNIQIDDLGKIREYQTILNNNFSHYYVPSNYLAIDEGIIPFKGKSKLKVYCPQKPVKFGIKEYLFCDYSGYTLKQKVNTPHEKDQNKDTYYIQNLQTQNIVNDLIQGQKSLPGSILIMDNYYNSLNLIHELTQQNIGVLGTVRPDRMNLTEEQKKLMKVQNFNVGETKSLVKDNIHMLLWRDKKKVIKMITNFLDDRKVVRTMKKTGQIKSVPLMVDIYNKYAHSVDKRNQICQNYRILKRSQKWWKCVFYRLLDTTLCNAYIIYKILNQGQEGKGKILSHKDFRIKIVEQIIESINSHTLLENNLSSRPRNIQNSIIDINKIRKQGQQQEILSHFLQKSNQQKNCYICNQLTFFICETCNYSNKKVALCPVDCHKRHMQKVYYLKDQ